jgi:hypothetical protein
MKEDFYMYNYRLSINKLKQNSTLLSFRKVGAA